MLLPFLLVTMVAMFPMEVSTTNTIYNIGVLVNDASLNVTIENVKNTINNNADTNGLGSSSRINVTWLELVSDPVQATKDICDHLISKSVYVVITTNAVNSSKSPDIVSYACAFYKIPTIVVQSRNTELSDKVSYFMINLIYFPPNLLFKTLRGIIGNGLTIKLNKLFFYGNTQYIYTI